MNMSILSRTQGNLILLKLNLFTSKSDFIEEVEGINIMDYGKYGRCIIKSNLLHVVKENMFSYIHQNFVAHHQASIFFLSFDNASV